MDTIPHSTMGDLAVGNYDLHPIRNHPVSGNAFIYNLIRHRWTLLQMNGSLSTQTTLYGIWQDGGNKSDNYTLAGGSSASGSQLGLLMSYNDRTGKVGRPRYYSYGNASARYTHFEGITAVRGGFNIVAESSAQSSSLAFIPFNARTSTYGTARWYPADVAASPLCASGCSFISGDTVYQEQRDGALHSDRVDQGQYLPRTCPRPLTKRPRPLTKRGESIFTAIPGALTRNGCGRSRSCLGPHGTRDC